MNSCTTCGSTHAKFTCKNCSKPVYCGVECQTQDWDMHSLVCLRIEDVPKERRMQLLDIVYGSNEPITENSDDNVKYAIIEAARFGLNDIIKILLERGANINVKNENGSTALSTASQYTNDGSSIETIQLLLDNGAVINFQTINGQTALMHAVTFSNTTSSLKTVKYLLDNGADIHLKKNVGSSVLMLAARYSNTTSSIETVQLLLDNGAHINDQSNTGATALVIAVQHSDEDSSLETVKLLLDNGANQHIRYGDGRTALWAAVLWSYRNSSIETVRLLLSYGADVNYTITTNQPKTVGDILQGQPPYTGSFLHTIIGNPDISLSVFHLLFNYGADVNAMDSNGRTPLGLAAARPDDPHELVHLMFLFDHL